MLGHGRLRQFELGGADVKSPAFQRLGSVSIRDNQESRCGFPRIWGSKVEHMVGSFSQIGTNQSVSYRVWNELRL